MYLEYIFFICICCFDDYLIAIDRRPIMQCTDYTVWEFVSPDPSQNNMLPKLLNFNKMRVDKWYLTAYFLL